MHIKYTKINYTLKTMKNLPSRCTERDRQTGVNLLLKNGDPVDAGEPAMSLDVIHAVLEVTEPLAQVRL